ncbi:MAG: hypothetical protein L3J44_01840 [Campylobacteraceae bacterium]|nr:hypothetical protein [Campylobacteraceae bacterium]
MSLRLLDYLKSAVNDVCADEKISLNQFIVNALSQVFGGEPYENDKL